MSDPIYLRNVMSNAIYAEQMNSAQIQGAQAARERAAKLRQEQILQEQAAVARSVEASKANIDERKEGRGSQQQLMEDQDETVEHRAEDASAEEGGEGGHIDLTV